MKTIYKNSKKFFEDLEPYKAPIIAEVANAHCGDIQKMKKLIDIASKSNTSVIKFQIFKTHERAERNTKEWSIFSKLEFSETQWEKIVRFCKKKKLFIIAEIYGEESLKFSKSLKINAYKIHSEDSLNINLILKTLKTSKPTLISVGGLKRLEILNLLKNIEDFKNQVILMTGVQSFPTPIISHSIFEVIDLLKKFNFKVGFADHVEGDTFMSECIAFMAISAGASIIEKHFTLKRSLKWNDYHSSLSDQNFINFTINFNKYKKILKNNLTDFNSDEKKYRKMFKKYPVLKKTIEKNKKIFSKDIVFRKIRSSKNIIKLSAIENKQTFKKINKNKVINHEYLKKRNGVIIVARNRSERLNNKCFLKIHNTEMIKIVIERAKKIENIEHIILATSTDKIDDSFKKIAKETGIDFFRGPSDNVANRFYQCAKKFKLDNIIRITGDAILVDYNMLNIILKEHLKNNNDVTFSKNMPFGTAKEIFTFETIEALAKNIVQSKNSEYLEFYLQNERYFNIQYIKSKYVFNKKIRLTLDYKEDFILLKKIFSYFPKKDRSTITIPQVLKFLNNNKNLIKINSFRIQKNPFNQKLNLNINF
jgi:N,N'-diacetyllegionaminate synthase